MCAPVARACQYRHHRIAWTDPRARSDWLDWIRHVESTGRARFRLVAAAPPDLRAPVAGFAGELPRPVDAERCRRVVDDLADLERAAGGPDADRHQFADVPAVVAGRRPGGPAGSAPPDSLYASADADRQLSAGRLDAARRDRAGRPARPDLPAGDRNGAQQPGLAVLDVRGDRADR